MKPIIKVIALVICLMLIPGFVNAIVNETSRLFGQDRYKTAFAISNYLYSDFVKAVVLAPSSNFANALPASVLAYKYQAPVLLINSSAVKTKEAFEYISNHLPKTGKIYLVGDSCLVGSDFETKLNQMGYYDIVRVSGIEKYETAYMIAKKINAPKGTPVVISSGENFPDALSISSFAAANGWPVLLSGRDKLTTKIREYIAENKPSTIYITGGTAVISSQVESEAEALVPNTVIKRFNGQDRYDTAIQIASSFAPSPINLYVASGQDFPDALAGSVLAAKSNSPIILVNPSASVLHPEVKRFLNQLKEVKSNIKMTFFGGPVAIPTELERLVIQEGGYMYHDFRTMEDEVLELVNQERYKRGLEPLCKNDTLTILAELKSQDMTNDNYFSHQSPTYGSPVDMLNFFGVSYKTWGENIAYGQSTAKEVMESWMNSSGHRANILKENFREIGIGAAKNNNGHVYWTQIFIQP